MQSVAIVGGGIAGLYVAWRLKQDAKAQYEVTLYEAGDRLGGRIRSLHIPPLRFRAELGAMRFHATHYLLRSLLTEFKIPTKKFDIPAPHFRVRGRTLSPRELISGECSHCGAAIPFMLRDTERGKTADALVTDAMTRLLHNLDFPEANYIEAQHYRRQILDGSYTRDLWTFVRRYGFYQDIRLRDIGFLNLLQHYLSNEAFQFVHDVFSLESVLANWNAAEAIPWILSDFSADDLSMVPGGLSRVTERLEEDLDPATLLKGMRVTKCIRAGEQWVLRFKDAPESRPYDHVVFALPLTPLKDIEFVPEVDMPWQDDVIGHRLYKMFLLYARPWWVGFDVPGSRTGRTYTDLPLRQVYYFHPEWMRECVDLACEEGKPECHTDSTRPEFGPVALLKPKWSCYPADGSWSNLHEMIAKWEGDRDTALLPSGIPLSKKKEFVPLWSLVMASYSDEHYVDFWHPPRPKEKRSTSSDPDERPDESPPYFNPPKGLSKKQRATLESAWNAIDPKLRVDSRIVRKVQQQLREIHRINDSFEDPVAGVFVDWSTEERTFGAGWHTWKITANPENHDLTAVESALHFCGEAWSRDQGWIEGALKTAECVLKRLGVEPRALAKIHCGIRNNDFNGYIGWRDEPKPAGDKAKDHSDK